MLVNTEWGKAFDLQARVQHYFLIFSACVLKSWRDIKY